MLPIHRRIRTGGIALATVTGLLLALGANGVGGREAVAQPLPTLHVGTTGKETDAEADATAEKYVALPPAEVVAALERGTIAAGNLSEPELSAQRGRYRILGYSYSAVAKRFAQTGWFASKSWIAQNPDLVTKFQAVIAQAAEWASNPANHARASQILAKYAGTATADARTQFARSLDPALIQPVIDQVVVYLRQ